MKPNKRRDRLKYTLKYDNINSNDNNYNNSSNYNDSNTTWTNDNTTTTAFNDSNYNNENDKNNAKMIVNILIVNKGVIAMWIFTMA